MNASIQQFVDGKRIAIAGASRSGTKFGNAACKELKARGYQVFLVHPEASEIEGETCYPNLAAIPGPVDGVLVSVPPAKAEHVLREASTAGIRKIWIQAGGETPDLLSVGRELGLDVVSGKCILMYAPPVRSFHRIHRVVNLVTGKL